MPVEFLSHAKTANAYTKSDSNVAKFINALVMLVESEHGETYYCEARAGSFVFGHEENSTEEPLNTDEIKQQLALFLYRNPEAARPGVFKFQFGSTVRLINITSIKSHLQTPPLASRDTFFGQRLKAALKYNTQDSKDQLTATIQLRHKAKHFEAWKEHTRSEATKKFMQRILGDSRRTPVESKGEGTPPKALGSGAFATVIDTPRF
jgi:hypothetical protein